MLTYHICLSVSIKSNADLIVTGLLDLGAGSIIVNKEFLPCRWKEIKNQTNLPPLRKANCEVAKVEGSVPLFVRTGDIHVLAWFGVVENIEVDELLGTLFIDQCISVTFPTESKVVFWHLRPLEIFSSKMAIYAI